VFVRLRLTVFAAAFGLLGSLGVASAQSSAQSYDRPPVPPLNVGSGYAAPSPRPAYSAQAPTPAPVFATTQFATRSDVPRPPANIGSGATPADYTGSIRQPVSTTPDRTSVIAALPPDEQPETGPAQLPQQFHRQLVSYPTSEPAGTIIIDTPHTFLYLVRGDGKALRYGIGVGREGFTWAGSERISRMSEWPDWHPPKEMIERQPYLPRFMAGGAGNPLGARALYLGSTLYRIHGTNQPSTIGHFVSSGCIRLTNDDIADLYSRVGVGTRVVVLPGSRPYAAAGQTPGAR
jgi:lipoprotein-anchoring transpeptidase ErfK/SrfK